MSPIPPNPPLRPVRAAASAVAVIVVAAIVGGCSVLLPPSVDGLLVATGGPLQVTDGSGDLIAFDGPTDPVVAATASDGRVVVATAGGTFRTSSGSESPRIWKDVAVPVRPQTGFPLMAVSPLGMKLALAVGELQGTTFDLVIVDVGLGTTQSIRVERGLNGPPAWIGPGIVAIDVIRDGESAIATIAIGSGAVTDGAIPGRVVSATIVGKLVAVDDPGSGDVLVGDTETVGTGPRDHVTRLVGPPGSGVDSLAISAAGGLLAVVRRSESGSASIELYRTIEGVWKSARTIQLPGDGPVSVAWLR